MMGNRDLASWRGSRATIIPPAADPPIYFREPLSAEQQRQVLETPKVRRWIDSLTTSFDVRAIAIDKVYFFGDKVGYVAAEADARRPDGTSVPGIAFIRGDSVAVLPILTTPDGQRHTVVVHQARPAIGAPEYAEIPAGMIDDGVFVSKAIDELAEEVGGDLKIGEEDLVMLETLHPSPGGCDEEIRIFCADIQVSQDLIDRLEGRRTGLAAEHESIRVAIVPLDDLPRHTPTDMKSKLAYYAYKVRIEPTLALRAETQPVDEGEGPAP